MHPEKPSHNRDTTAATDDPKVAYRTMDYLGRPFRYLEQHSHTAQAIAAIGSFAVTLSLAAIAYLSWSDNRDLRELEFKQYVVSNLPSVRIYAAESKFEFLDDFVYIIWKVSNIGGLVRRVHQKAIFVL